MSLPSTNSITRKYWPSSPRPTSKICTMLRCLSSDSTFASAISSSTNRRSCDRCGRIRLIATGFSKPPAATALPRKISAMPPTPMRSSSSYRVTSGSVARLRCRHMDAGSRALLDDALARRRSGSAAARLRWRRRAARSSGIVAGTRAGSPIAARRSTSTRAFDLASVTKPMATVAIAMVLVGERRLDLDAPVRRWLPAAATTGTVRQLLGHAAGCAAHVEFFRRLRAARPVDPRATLVELAAARAAASPPASRRSTATSASSSSARCSSAPRACRSSRRSPTLVAGPLGLRARYATDADCRRGRDRARRSRPRLRPRPRRELLLRRRRRAATPACSRTLDDVAQVRRRDRRHRRRYAARRLRPDSSTASSPTRRCPARRGASAGTRPRTRRASRRPAIAGRAPARSATPASPAPRCGSTCRTAAGSRC